MNIKPINKARNLYKSRKKFVVVTLFFVASILAYRAIDLQVITNDHLRQKAQRQYISEIEIPAYRGKITDRHGNALAISTPVHSIWMNDNIFNHQEKNITALSNVLGINKKRLLKTIKQNKGRSFFYLRKRVKPSIAQNIHDLKIDGVHLLRDVKRFYPSGEIFSHIIGFTDTEDLGLEGLELAYNDWLKGEKGQKRIYRNLRRQIIHDETIETKAKPGKDLVLSLDKRIQYIAYRELKKAVVQYEAKSASAVVLDIKTGEVLALVNEPTFNPNNRRKLKSSQYRNRAVTDVFEPGSTIKPFTVASALDYGSIKTTTKFDTKQGVYRVGRKVVRDSHEFGVIDVSTIIRKSSNIGALKIALSMPTKYFWQTLSNVGFGSTTGSAYPGEASGILHHFSHWNKTMKVTVSYGYGLSTTALQLARAYSILASGGILKPVSFAKTEAPGEEIRVYSKKTTQKVVSMMEQVVSARGTGNEAKVKGYRVAGKTGTVHKYRAGRYEEKSYLSLFAGFAPVSNPRLAMVVIMDEPGAGEYYGGKVAAPVFSKIMSRSLSTLNIAPDDRDELNLIVVNQRNTLYDGRN